MRFTPSIFAQLLEPICRREAARLTEAHAGDRYVKTFGTWDHLLTLCFAQASGSESLREVEARWNAQRNHHYHLGARPVSRATLCDANRRRTPAVFAEVFARLSAQADRSLRSDGAEMVRLIDSSPIPLEALCDWAPSNGRIRGLKMHVVYDPKADQPRRVDITLANVNDVEIGKLTELEKGATYVFDKGYYLFDWWKKIHDFGAKFVTRPKANTRFDVLRQRPFTQIPGDGFTILEDAEVKLASKGDSKLDMPLRRVRIERDTGAKLEIITNDMESSAHDIALLYKSRWQIELLFRWIKQHLKLRRFLGRSENAVRLQVLAAMIVFLLLRLAARRHRSSLPPLRFAELVRDALFVRKPMERVDKPNEVNPSKPQPNICPGQAEFSYA